MNIEKIKPANAVIFVAYLSIFFEVILSFFLLERSLFYSLTIWQLIGIGLGISLPFMLVNYCLWAFFCENNYSAETPDENELKTLIGGFLLSSITYTPLLLVAYGISFKLKEFYWLLLFGQILTGIIVLFVQRRKISQNNNKTVE